MVQICIKIKTSYSGLPLFKSRIVNSVVDSQLRKTLVSCQKSKDVLVKNDPETLDKI